MFAFWHYNLLQLPLGFLALGLPKLARGLLKETYYTDHWWFWLISCRVFGRERESSIEGCGHIVVTIGGTDNTVKQTFSGSQISSLGANVASVDHMIAPSSPANVLGNGFFGAIRHNWCVCILCLWMKKQQLVNKIKVAFITSAGKGEWIRVWRE